jgi:CBS domain-containing protein
MNQPDPAIPSKRRTGPFGPAGEILPANQSIETLRPEDTLFQAVERLCDEGYNQAPVVDDHGECLGVMRLFDVIRDLLGEQWFRDKLSNMSVRNHVDLKPRYIAADEWVDVLFDWQGDDIAMVGSPSELKGMLTAADILRRLTDYARGFVHIEEIEHDTRDLFQFLLPLPECTELVRNALTTKGKEPPQQLDSYTGLEFGHYALIFGNKETFERLQHAVVWDRVQLVNRVSRVAKIRNNLVHFRAKTTPRDIDELEAFANHSSLALKRARSGVGR